MDAKTALDVTAGYANIGTIPAEYERAAETVFNKEIPWTPQPYDDGVRCPFCGGHWLGIGEYCRECGQRLGAGN